MRVKAISLIRIVLLAFAVPMLHIHASFAETFDAGLRRRVRDMAMDVGIQQIAAERFGSASNQRPLQQCGRDLSDAISPVVEHAEVIKALVLEVNDTTSAAKTAVKLILLPIKIDTTISFIDDAIQYSSRLSPICESRSFNRQVEEANRVLG